MCRGGLKKESQRSVSREHVGSDRSKKRIERQTEARERMEAEIIKTVNFFLMEKCFNNSFFNSIQACTLLFFSA